MVKNNLQQLRWDKNWSQQQLALFSNVDRSLIGKIENSERPNPSIETALLLSRALGVPVEKIFQVE